MEALARSDVPNILSYLDLALDELSRLTSSGQASIQAKANKVKIYPNWCHIHLVPLHFLSLSFPLFAVIFMFSCYISCQQWTHPEQQLQLHQLLSEMALLVTPFSHLETVKRRG